jgi:hypothetical protein
MLMQWFYVQNQKYSIDFDEQEVTKIERFIFLNTIKLLYIQDEIQRDSILIDEDFHNSKM